MSVATRLDVEEGCAQSAVDKALALLDKFDCNEVVGVSELARRAGLSKSTAFRLLGILQRNGFVDRYEAGYTLGRGLFNLGARMYEQEPGVLRELCMPYLTELYEATRETVHMAVLQGVDVVYLEKLYGHRRAPSPSRVGARLPAYITAVGKMLLSLAPDAADRVLEGNGLRRFTHKTIHDPDRLAAQLDRIRIEGVAYDDEEAALGLRCVAVPIFDAHGHPVAALSLAGATTRFDPRASEHRLRSVAAAASVLVRSATAARTRASARAVS